MAPLMILVLAVLAAVPAIRGGDDIIDDTDVTDVTDAVDEEDAAAEDERVGLIAKKPCSIKCRQTCLRPNPPALCGYNPACFCPLGYVYLDDLSNTCVKISDCPKNPCNGDPHAHIQSPITACPPTCENPHPNCNKERFVGCACDNGYILSQTGGTCIKSIFCPQVGNNDDQTGRLAKPCPGECKQTCDRPNYKPPKECSNYLTCSQCPNGYVFLDENSNQCVKICDCPKKVPCPSNCKLTCDRPNFKPPRECASIPACFICPPGSVFLNENTNQCVKVSDCPGKKPCPNKCKQTCTQPIPPKSCAHNPKCFCPPGYVFLNALSNKCVKICDCPGKSCNGDPNAHLESPVSACPPTCDNPHPNCQKELFKGCACNPGYILDKPGGICIKQKDCPCDSCNGDPNAHLESPVSACPPTCDNPNPNCQREFFKGCACNPGYILDKPGGKCIKQKDCPCNQCGINEAINPCPTFCWTDSCKDLYRRGVPCESLVAIECIPACQCKDDYARDDNGNCIPIDQCPN